MRTHRNRTIPLCCIALALGLGTAQGSALWDINKDKTAVVQAVHYEENYLFGQLAYRMAAATCIFSGRRTPTGGTSGNPATNSRTSARATSPPTWKTIIFKLFSGTATASALCPATSGKLDVCGQTNIGYTANLTRTGPNPGYFSTGGRGRVYDDGATLKNESLNRTGRTTCEL